MIPDRSTLIRGMCSGVSREAAIVDHGVVCTGELDDDSLSYAEVDVVGS